MFLTFATIYILPSNLGSLVQTHSSRPQASLCKYELLISPRCRRGAVENSHGGNKRKYGWTGDEIGRISGLGAESDTGHPAETVFLILYQVKAIDRIWYLGRIRISDQISCGIPDIWTISDQIPSLIHTFNIRPYNRHNKGRISGLYLEIVNYSYITFFDFTLVDFVMKFYIFHLLYPANTDFDIRPYTGT